MAAALPLQPSTTASATTTATAVALGEVEDEGLLASLFRDRFPEAQWREKPDVGRYLRELSGSGLDRLRREPERLAEERAQRLQQTRDLAFANYKTFIRGAECTERIHRLFGDVEASLGRLLDRLPRFLQVLETDLYRGIGGRLDSLLGQCMYFGLSFSRVGADFRGQLAPVFQRVAISTFQKAVEEAVEKFQDEMTSYTLISTAAILGSSNTPATVPATQPGTLQPPMVLLDFPPLACFLNNILVAFNDLRLCCPVALAQDVTGTLENALTKVTKTILAFHRAEEAVFSSGEHEIFVQFCTAFLEDLVPYLNRCLQVLFPPAQIAQTLGISPTQLSKHGNLGHVNISAIQETPDLVAPAPELPAEQRSMEPVTEKREPGEPLPQEPMEGEPLPAEPPSEGGAIGSVPCPQPGEQP